MTVAMRALWFTPKAFETIAHSLKMSRAAIEREVTHVDRQVLHQEHAEASTERVYQGVERAEASAYRREAGIERTEASSYRQDAATAERNRKYPHILHPH